VVEAAMYHAPSIHTELARQRHEDLLSSAQRDRLGARAVSVTARRASIREFRRPHLALARLVHRGRTQLLPA
jgi:hypothetical protein